MRRYLPHVFLFLLPMVCELPALTGKRSPEPRAFTASLSDDNRNSGGIPWADPNVGFQAQALGKLSAELWLQGEVPWWNTYNGVGLPLAAEAQPAALFLPFVLLSHFQNGLAIMEVVLQILAGLCMFAFLKKLGIREPAALAGAVVFQLNGTFAWHGAPISSPVAFLPMLLLGVEHVRRSVQAAKPGGWALVSVALAWSIYAGFPETAYLNGLFAAVWVLARLDGLATAAKKRFILTLTWAVVVGLLCALPQIVPFAEYLLRSDIGGHAGAFEHAQLPREAIAVSLMPLLYGPIVAFPRCRRHFRERLGQRRRLLYPPDIGSRFFSGSGRAQD